MSEKSGDKTDEIHSLPIHVARCEERYKTLFDRLKNVENWVKTAVVAIIATMGSIIYVLINRAFPGG